MKYFYMMIYYEIKRAPNVLGGGGGVGGCTNRKYPNRNVIDKRYQSELYDKVLENLRVL